jgi:ABC-type proline/glycine betaine transport system permease subunit
MLSLLATSSDNSSLHVVSYPILVAGFVAAVAWLMVVLVVRVFRRSDEPEAAPATMDLGTESPAIANMLVNNWKPTQEAVPGTLLDLAARGYVEFQQVAPGQFECRIRRQDDPELKPYERRVMTLLRSKAAHGVVPTEALTTGPTDAADRWWKGFRKEVVREAKDIGVSEDMWNAASKSVVTVAGFLLSISSLFYIIVGQFFFSKLLKLVPISGFAGGADVVLFLALPVLIGIASRLGGEALFYRTMFLEEIGKDYVRTARSKGLSETVVLFRHVLRNAMLPILTSTVAVLPLLFLGALIMESFFGIPGLGSYTIDAINSQDFAVVRSMVFVGSVLYIIGLILTDISYTVADPRIRLS